MHEDEAILHLTDTLLPGGTGFPAARDAAMAGLLLQRLRQADPAGPAKLLAALSSQGALPESPAAWTETASRLEAIEPDLFNEFRKYIYLTYYEQPSVIEAIRALGHRYNDAPLPDGYPDESSDPRRDVPVHGRGRWVDTDDVRRVSLAGLDLESLR